MQISDQLSFVFAFFFWKAADAGVDEEAYLAFDEINPAIKAKAKTAQPQQQQQPPTASKIA